jgi:uncharacterized protein (DUF2267 family)
MLILRDTVPEKEFRDTLTQLPHEFRELLRDDDTPPGVAGHTMDAAAEGGQLTTERGGSEEWARASADRSREYDEFIDRVAERAGISREHAQVLTHAVLEVLADRISGGQALDVAAMLPDELAAHLRKAPQKEPEKYGFDEFVGKVHERAANVPREEIRPGIRAVMLTLREFSGQKEFADTLAQLPHQFQELLQEEGAPEAGQQEDHLSGGGRTVGSAPRAARPVGGPNPEAAMHDSVVRRIAERAGLSAHDAAHLTQATLETLGDRIGGATAHDLAQRLPGASAEWLDEPPETPPQNYGPDGFVSRVRDLATGVQDDDITPGIQAVMIALREAVGEAEIEIALSPLPGEYDELVVRVG